MKPEDSRPYTAVKSEPQQDNLGYPLWEVVGPDGRAFAWGSQVFCERYCKSLNEGPVVLPN